MFFVRKESIGTALGAQKEFQAAARRSVSFFSAPLPNGNKCWHYLWPEGQVESSIKATSGGGVPVEPDYYIWSQEVSEGALVGDPLITPFDEANIDQWKEKAEQLFAAAA